ERSSSPVERGEESISLSVNFHTAVAGEGRAQQTPVLRQQLGIRTSLLPEQPSRALNIAEKQRDRARRQPPHPFIIAPPSRSRNGRARRLSQGRSSQKRLSMRASGVRARCGPGSRP